MKFSKEYLDNFAMIRNEHKTLLDKRIIEICVLRAKAVGITIVPNGKERVWIDYDSLDNDHEWPVDVYTSKHKYERETCFSIDCYGKNHKLLCEAHLILDDLGVGYGQMTTDDLFKTDEEIMAPIIKKYEAYKKQCEANADWERNEQAESARIAQIRKQIAKKLTKEERKAIGWGR